MAGFVSAMMLSGTMASGHEPAPGSQVGTHESLTPPNQQEILARTNLRVGHPELGEINLVQRQPKPKLLTLSTSQLFSYTSNAFLRPDDEKGTTLWNGRFAGTVVPYATRSVTPSVSFEQNFFRFDRYSSLDFDTQTAAASLKLDLTRDDSWSMTTSAAFTRLYTERFDAGDFYKYALLSQSVTHIRQLGGSPIYSGTSLGGTWRLGNPSTFDRFAVFLNLAAIYSPTESLQFAAFVRPELHAYTNHDSRVSHHSAGQEEAPDPSPTDFNLSAGASITWIPIKEVAVSANFLWTGNWSTFGPHNYEVSNPSLGLSAAIAF